jgi:hexosaminidase
MYPASYHYSIDPMKAPGVAPGHEGQARPEDPKQPASGTPSGLTAEQAKLILGGEAAMWDELATPENLDAKLWPRLAAISERFWSPESVTDVHSMYRRLDITNQWLQWLGLTQRSSLELMRQRLTQGQPHEPLDIFASVLEPTKGYSRNAETYTHFVPLNRLVDAISPESDAARWFREDVDEYLAMPSTERSSQAIRDRLSDWAKAAAEVHHMGETNSLLAENIPVADAVGALCRAALESLDHLEGKSSARADWKEQARTSVAKYSYKRMGDLLTPIAPGIAKLVDAVP